MYLLFLSCKLLFKVFRQLFNSAERTLSRVKFVYLDLRSNISSTKGEFLIKCMANILNIKIGNI